MSFRRAAGTVARRWLAGGEVSSGGAGRFGSGGHEFVAGRVARFWSFGGSKGDGEDGGEDGAVGDRDAGKVSEASASVEAGDATERPEAGTSEARLAEETDRLSPESKSPRWNVPDDFADAAAETNVVPSSETRHASVEPVVNRPKKEKKKKKPRGDPTVTSSVERFGRRVKNDKLPEDASSAPRNLYVKNLPRDFNAKKLAHLFMPHGDVQSTKFVLDAGPVPTGLVRFATAEEAAAATAALHGATLSADDADFSASDSGSSESSDVDSDSHTGLTTQTETVRLEISLAMTRAERDAARVARAEEREKRKQRRAERAERVKRLATSRTSGDKSLAKDGFAVRVTHVPVGLDHKQLRSIFVAFGKLGRVKMMWPNGEVPSAVVTFRDEAAANAAAASLAGEYLPGCKGPMAFEAHKSARVTRKKTRTKERGVKKKSEEEEGEESSESSSDSEDSEDSSSSESERESASPSSELSPNEVLNSDEEGEEVAPLFVLRPESVTITDKITARADAARAAAGRVWRDVQASRAVSSPEALEKAKALNAAATARAKALRDEKRERGEPLANVGSDSNSAVAPADLLRRRREARGVFADTPHAAQTAVARASGIEPARRRRVAPRSRVRRAAARSAPTFRLARASATRSSPAPAWTRTRRSPRRLARSSRRRRRARGRAAAASASPTPWRRCAASAGAADREAGAARLAADRAAAAAAGPTRARRETRAAAATATRWTKRRARRSPRASRRREELRPRSLPGSGTSRRSSPARARRSWKTSTSPSTPPRRSFPGSA
jgi:hypothetical protein